MRPIDADSLIAKYEQKMKENENNKNALILLHVLIDSVNQEDTVDIAPAVLPTGHVAEYDNGMVAMRGETYAGYIELATKGLPTRHVPKRMDAVEYLKALKKMHQGKPMKQFLALFPKGETEEEKVAIVEEWAKANME